MKVVIALVVFVSFTALMNSNVIAANKSTKPDKAGFTKSTEITMQDYSMSVPTYWNSDIYDKDVYRAYCNNDNFVMMRGKRVISLIAAVSLLFNKLDILCAGFLLWGPPQ